MEPDSEGRPRGYSPALGLDLVWEEAILRFYDPAADEWLKTHEEEQAARIAAQTQAAVEQAARATAESMLAAAEARAAELEAELRRLRGDAT